MWPDDRSGFHGGKTYKKGEIVFKRYVWTGICGVIMIFGRLVIRKSILKEVKGLNNIKFVFTNSELTQSFRIGG